MNNGEYNEIYILSDKYHVLQLNEKKQPYECIPLSKRKIVERKQWAAVVLKALKEKCDLENDKFLILAGKSYWEFLIGKIKGDEPPMKGLRIGEQLQFLNTKIKEIK